MRGLGCCRNMLAYFDLTKTRTEFMQNERDTIRRAEVSHIILRMFVDLQLNLDVLVPQPGLFLGLVSVLPERISAIIKLVPAIICNPIEHF